MPYQVPLEFQAKDYFDFHYDFLTSEYDMNEQQGKLRIASEMLASIKKVPSAIVRDGLMQQLSQKMGISAEVLRAELKKVRSDYRPFSNKSQIEARRLTAEEELIHYALCFSDSINEIMKAIRPEDFQRPHCREIASVLYTLAGEKGEVSFDDVLHRVRNEEQSSILTELMVLDDFPEREAETLEELIDGVLANKRLARKDELKQLMDEASRENRCIDPDLQNEYFELHRSLMKRGRVRFRTR